VVGCFLFCVLNSVFIEKMNWNGAILLNDPLEFKQREQEYIRYVSEISQGKIQALAFESKIKIIDIKTHFSGSVFKGVEIVKNELVTLWLFALGRNNYRELFDKINNYKEKEITIKYWKHSSNDYLIASVNESPPINILVVGKTGVGKSAVTSMLINGDVHNGNNNGIIVSDQARGVTFECQIYKGEQFNVIDTIGFGEGQEGKIFTADAIRSLRKFLHASQTGYNIILFVSRLGRITDSDRNIFKMFHDVLLEDLRDRFHIVVTG
jgi:GTP-binding protein EngB required for normal cell division